MQYLLLAFAALAVAVFAPLAVSLSLLAVIVVVSLVVKITASRIIGPTSFKDAARAVAWSFTLLVAACP